MLCWMVEREGLEENWRKINRSKAKRTPPATVTETAPVGPLPQVREPVPGVPDYDTSRARHEFEKANLAELERKRREGELIDRETVGRSLAKLMSILRGGLLALPSTLRDRVPHLTPEDIDVAETLIRLQLEELAAGIVADGLPVLSDG
jgi:hypothetical protein